MERCRDLRFTPNFDPKNETFVLQPVASADDSPTVAEEDEGAVSDILPGLGDDAIVIEIEPGNRHRIGDDDVSFRLTSAMDGYLTVQAIRRRARQLHRAELFGPTAVE